MHPPAPSPPFLLISLVSLQEQRQYHEMREQMTREQQKVRTAAACWAFMAWMAVQHALKHVWEAQWIGAERGR